MLDAAAIVLRKQPSDAVLANSNDFSAPGPCGSCRPSTSHRLSQSRRSVLSLSDSDVWGSSECVSLHWLVHIHLPLAFYGNSLIYGWKRRFARNTFHADERHGRSWLFLAHHMMFYAHSGQYPALQSAHSLLCTVQCSDRDPTDDSDTHGRGYKYLPYWTVMDSSFLRSISEYLLDGTVLIRSLRRVLTLSCSDHL